MTSKNSLLEQKKLQWAKEKEEMARLNGHSNAKYHHQGLMHADIKTYPTNTRLLSREASTGTGKNKPLRAIGNYGSTSSLRSLVEPRSSHTTTSLRTIDFSTGSLVNLLDNPNFPASMRRRSPSLPPIYTKDNQPPSLYVQERTNELGVEGSPYTNQLRAHKQHYRQPERSAIPYEEREGETSGYASDSIEAPPIPSANYLGAVADSKRVGSEMSERTWQNPYCETPETSLPPSRIQSVTRIGELNRQRWGSVWGTDSAGKTDPPPPSWLERGLSRLDHSSQILVINHDSASSPDSSTAGSTGSDSRTYIRGQNIPVDAQVLQEREAKRQRALELQNAIKQQLEEKDRQRKAEREQRLREELEEEERIKRERDEEQERLEEERKKMHERECAKLKKEAAMREVLESAERQAREEKRQRRQRDTSRDSQGSVSHAAESNCWESPKIVRGEPECPMKIPAGNEEKGSKTLSEKNEEVVEKFEAINDPGASTDTERSLRVDFGGEGFSDKRETLRLPVGKEVAIVLSGRLEDPDFLNKANLQLVNLVVTSPRLNDNSSTLGEDLGALVKNFGGPVILRRSPRSIKSPKIAENRLLTPSKYRHFPSNARDFGTQTDCESENPDSKDHSFKDRKDVVNNGRRDAEKSTNTGPSEESKSLSRSKSQPRTSLESRPRWNANRPGTRYRTQSEKDPHYQRRMRLRRRRVESSDERSRSPSPDRRKPSSQKSKNRNCNRRKVKLDSYDADLSMDSLNSIVPLRIDEHGRVNLIAGDHKKKRNDDRGAGRRKHENDDKLDLWCGQEILSQLASLRNGLLSKQREWDPQRCLISPGPDFY